MRMFHAQQSSFLILFVHAPVLHGFGDVRGLDVLIASQIGDGACDLEDAMVGARRQTEAGDGLTQQGFALCIGRAVAVDLGDGKLRVGFVLSRELALPRGFHASLYGRAGFAVGLLEQVFLRHGGDFDLDVDAIQQWAGDLAAITRHLIGRAAAFSVVVTEVTAGTRVHRGDELELGFEVGASGRARDGDASALQRFAQDFQDVAIEFGQLV
jgi:hypothetical protein